MTLDNLIMIFKIDNGIEGPKDRDIQASLTLNQPGNLGKYWMYISDFSNYMVF